MAKLTQGTQIYFIDPDTDTLTEVQCVTTFNPGGAPADQIETTCLTSTDKTYLPGLRTPGQASMEINVDPTYASHVRLQALANSSTTPFKWAVAWSDGTTAPTVDSSGEFDLSLDSNGDSELRSFTLFDAYVSDFPFDFSTNSVVKTAVTLQRSGVTSFYKKAV